MKQSIITLLFLTFYIVLFAQDKQTVNCEISPQVLEPYEEYAFTSGLYFYFSPLGGVVYKTRHVKNEVLEEYSNEYGKETATIAIDTAITSHAVNFNLSLGYRVYFFQKDVNKRIGFDLKIFHYSYGGKNEWETSQAFGMLSPGLIGTYAISTEMAIDFRTHIGITFLANSVGQYDIYTDQNNRFVFTDNIYAGGFARHFDITGTFRYRSMMVGITFLSDKAWYLGDGEDEASSFQYGIILGYSIGHLFRD